MPRDNAELATEPAGAEAAPHVDRGAGGSHHHAAGSAAVARIAGETGRPKLESNGGAFLVHSYPVRFPGTAVDAVLPPSTYVEIGDITAATGDTVPCTVYSGFGGLPASIPRNVLRSEPRMGHGQGAQAGTPADYSYVRHHGPLWHGAPKVEDVAQGYLGDCYLISALGAVVSSNPHAITAMFSPHTPNAPRYSVTLHRRGPGGHFIRHVELVDSFLPSQQVAGGAASAATYADNGRQSTDRSATAKPLWPALIEKAYAQMIGGYDVAGQGGSSTTAMEAMTGRAGEVQPVPGTDAEILQLLRGMQGKFAMAAGTLSSRRVTDQGGFRESAAHQFQADFMTDQGQPPEIMTNSLEITHLAAAPTPAAAPAPSVTTMGPIVDPGSGVVDAGSTAVAEPVAAPVVEQVPTANDDGTGKIVGAGVSGTVDYEQGKVTVAYDPATVKATVNAASLRAAYAWEGLLDKDLTVYANHAYIFERVTADGLIHLRNPWGIQHPKPMTAADFRRLCVNVYADQVPQTPRHPAHHPAPRRPTS